MFTWSILSDTFNLIICVHITKAIGNCLIQVSRIYHSAIYDWISGTFWFVLQITSRFAIVLVHSTVVGPPGLSEPSVCSLRCHAANPPADKRPNSSRRVPQAEELVCPKDKQGLPGLPLRPRCRLKGKRVKLQSLWSVCFGAHRKPTTLAVFCRATRDGNVRGLRTPTTQAERWTFLNLILNFSPSAVVTKYIIPINTFICQGKLVYYGCINSRSCCRRA